MLSTTASPAVAATVVSNGALSPTTRAMRSAGGAPDQRRPHQVDAQRAGAAVGADDAQAGQRDTVRQHDGRDAGQCGEGAAAERRCPAASSAHAPAPLTADSTGAWVTTRVWAPGPASSASRTVSICWTTAGQVAEVGLQRGEADVEAVRPAACTRSRLSTHGVWVKDGVKLTLAMGSLLPQGRTARCDAERRVGEAGVDARRVRGRARRPPRGALGQHLHTDRVQPCAGRSSRGSTGRARGGRVGQFRPQPHLEGVRPGARRPRAAWPGPTPGPGQRPVTATRGAVVDISWTPCRSGGGRHQLGAGPAEPGGRSRRPRGPGRRSA